MTLRYPDLPILALRLHVARAIGTRRLDYAGYLRDGDAEAVLERLAKLADSAAPGKEEYRIVPADEAATFAFLCNYFHKVGAELSLKEGYRAASSEKAKDLLEALEPVLASSPCEGCCKAGTEAVCKWTPASRLDDERLLKASPKCLEPARAVFEMVNELARDAYLLAGNSDALPFSLELDVVKLGGGMGSPAIDGETDESPEPHRRTISLRVRAEDFKHAEYLNLPYLFAHECVAHGYCGVALKTADHYLSTSFQEGWMDEVASLLLKEALGSEYAQTPGFEAWLGRAEVVETMNDTRSWRNSYEKRRTGDVALIEDGVAAFKAFCYCLDAARGVEAHLRPSAEAVSIALDFSLVLNISYVSHEVRGFFVKRVADLYDRGDRASREMALVRRPEVTGICRRYLASAKTFRDVESLVMDVVAIAE